MNIFISLIISMISGYLTASIVTDTMIKDKVSVNKAGITGVLMAIAISSIIGYVCGALA